MPTNANTFNSRVTSEALEKKFRDVFPAQGGAELVQDLYASGVVQPVIDFSSVAEGSVLAPDLQTAWDFSTGSNALNNITGATLITNTGFWQVDLTVTLQETTTVDNYRIYINDGTTSKNIWGITGQPVGVGGGFGASDGKFVVFLRAGDSLLADCSANGRLDVWYRQIADVNGTLVNPLGFTFS